MFRTTGRAAGRDDAERRRAGASGSAAPAGAKTTAVKVEINDDGCPAKLTIKAGPTTFKVSNDGSGDVSEFEVLSGDRIIGEVENVAPGLNNEFSLTLKPGKYTTKCPGGSKHSNGKLVVTGTAATKLSRRRQGRGRPVPPVPRGADRGARHRDQGVHRRGRQPATSSRPSRCTRRRGSRTSAIEPVAETFGDLDPKIDAREGDVPKKEWGGFHYIEQELWVDGTTDGLTSYTKALNDNVETLAEPGEGRRAAAGAASPTARSSCSTRCRRRRSPVRRSATRAPTCVDFEANVQGAAGRVRRGEADPRRRRTPTLASRDRRQVRRRHRRARAVPDGHHVRGLHRAHRRPTRRRSRRSIDALAEPLSKVGQAGRELVSGR